MAHQIDFIADTSAVVGLLRRDPAVEQIFTGKNFAITFVTLAELSLGVLKAARPDAAWARIREVLRDGQMLHVSPVTSAIYARIYFDLERRGALIPINDIWIGALGLNAECRSSPVTNISRG